MTAPKTITVAELAKKMKVKPSQVAIALLPYGIDATGDDFPIDIEIANKLQGLDNDIKSLKAATPEPTPQHATSDNGGNPRNGVAPQTSLGYISQTSGDASLTENKGTGLSLQDCQLIAEVHEISVQKVQELEQILSSEEEALALASGVYDAEKHIALRSAGRALVFTQEYQRRQEANSATRKKIVEGRLNLAGALQEQGIDIYGMMDGLQASELERQKALNTSLTQPFDLEQLNQVIAILSPTGMDVNDLISGAILAGTPAYNKAEQMLKINGINLKSFITRQTNFKAIKDEKKDQSPEPVNSLGLDRLINFSKVSARQIPQPGEPRQGTGSTYK